MLLTNFVWWNWLFFCRFSNISRALLLPVCSRGQRVCSRRWVLKTRLIDDSSWTHGKMIQNVSPVSFFLHSLQSCPRVSLQCRPLCCSVRLGKRHSGSVEQALNSHLPNSRIGVGTGRAKSAALPNFCHMEAPIPSEQFSVSSCAPQYFGSYQQAFDTCKSTISVYFEFLADQAKIFKRHTF